MEKDIALRGRVGNCQADGLKVGWVTDGARPYRAVQDGRTGRLVGHRHKTYKDIRTAFSRLAIQRYKSLLLASDHYVLSSLRDQLIF